MSSKNQTRGEDPDKKIVGHHVIIILVVMGIGGLLLRLSHMYADVPVILDATVYFWYANDVALLDALPRDHTPINNGWPIFLSLFFQFVDSGNFLDYMLVQRLVSMVLSVMTIIPVYVICRRFFSAKLALVGPAIFAFEPRIAENSIMGITEPLFVLLVAITIACFLSSQRRVVCLTFPVLALATMVRGEALVLIVPYAILYMVRFRRSRKTMYEAPLLVLLFVLILVPMSMYRIDVTGSDGMFVRVYSALDRYLTTGQGATGDLFIDGQAEIGVIEKLEKITGIIANASLTSMPIIIFLIPYGLYRNFRCMKMENISIITILSFMIIFTIYIITSTPGSRYLFLMVPILCIFCIFSVEKLSSLFPRRDLALVIIMGVIIMSSIMILENKRIDIEHEREAIQIAKIVSEKTVKINHYLLESSYLATAVLNEIEFPILKNDVKTMGGGIKHCIRLDESECDSIIFLADGMDDFVKKSNEKNITHLIVDEREHRRAQFMIDVFKNEEQYPYLTKIYDSRDDGFSYHVKIFEINHEMIASMQLKTTDLRS